jgi:hypothetical protein
LKISKRIKFSVYLSLSSLLLNTCSSRLFQSEKSNDSSFLKSSVDLDFAQYLTACSTKLETPLKDIPQIDCTKGDNLVVTVNGQKLDHTKFTSGMQCDNPSLIGNQSMACMPNSWAGTVEVPGTPTQWVFLCRQFSPRPEGTKTADVVGLIARNKNTGATCFFESKETKKGLFLPSAPKLQDDMGVKFWKTPAEIVQSSGSDCVTCHTGQVWLRTPFISKAKIPSNEALPGDKEQKYWVVEADALEKLNPAISWTPRKLVGAGVEKTCTGCHRVGDRSFCKSYSPISLGEETVPRDLSEAILKKNFPESNLHWSHYNTKLKRFGTLKEWRESVFYKGFQGVSACCENGNKCNWQNLTELAP